MADDITGMRAELGMPADQGDDLRTLFADVRTVAGTIEVSQQLLDQFKPIEIKDVDGVGHSFDVYMADQLAAGMGLEPRFVWPGPKAPIVPKFTARQRARIAVCGFRARVALRIAPWLYEDPPDPWDED